MDCILTGQPAPDNAARPTAGPTMPISALSILAVFAGAGCGALLRWGLGLLLNPVLPLLPLGTLAANLGGGFLIGMALAYFSVHPDVAVEWRLLVITGFLGGLTTFSTFSGEVVDLLQRQHYAWALAVAGAHLTGSLLLTGMGIALARALWTRV